jgi:AcrR family transcriptional regulator
LSNDVVGIKGGFMREVKKTQVALDRTEELAEAQRAADVSVAGAGQQIGDNAPLVDPFDPDDPVAEVRSHAGNRLAMVANRSSEYQRQRNPNDAPFLQATDIDDSHPSKLGIARQNRIHHDSNRTNRTLHRLMIGLGRAISKQGLANVSVVDIAHESGVSRGTIYLHFKGKDDMCRQLENTIIAHCCAILYSTRDETGDPDRMYNADATVSQRMVIEKQIDRIHDDRWKKDSSFELVSYGALHEIISYLRTDKTLLQPLMGPGGDPAFVLRATNSVARIFQMRAQSVKTYKFTYQGLPEKYGITAMLSGLMGILQRWIADGMVESDDTILEYIHIAAMSSPAMLAL